jgi:proline iminopeptidase
MRHGLIFAIVAAALAAPSRPGSAGAMQPRPRATPHERRIPVGNATLYAREIGRGQPIIVLHGGPDFDHRYLLPEMDRFSDAFRLIYYDQRGRGRSGDGVNPDDVTMASEVSDLDQVRQHFQLPAAAILGHSWGAVLALEYALKYPERVSHLIIMNPAPASAQDARLLRAAYRQKLGSDLDRLMEVAATAGYREGDPDTVAAYYRIHFKIALHRPADFERVISRLRAGFTRDNILKGRAVEERLVSETWAVETYDLLPRLGGLKIPTLVLYGDAEFIPAEAATHIAHAIPRARMVTFKACGHFSYLECPAAVRKELGDFFRATRAPARDSQELPREGTIISVKTP